MGREACFNIVNLFKFMQPMSFRQPDYDDDDDNGYSALDGSSMRFPSFFMWSGWRSCGNLPHRVRQRAG